jgi:hypothetical protein
MRMLLAVLCCLAILSLSAPARASFCCVELVVDWAAVVHAAAMNFEPADVDRFQDRMEARAFGDGLGIYETIPRGRRAVADEQAFMVGIGDLVEPYLDRGGNIAVDDFFYRLNHGQPGMLDHGGLIRGRMENPRYTGCVAAVLNPRIAEQGNYVLRVRYEPAEGPSCANVSDDDFVGVITYHDLDARPPN